jgi:hypothetical protein
VTGDSFTQADINAGVVTYTHTANNFLMENIYMTVRDVGHMYSGDAFDLQPVLLDIAFEIPAKNGRGCRKPPCELPQGSAVSGFAFGETPIEESNTSRAVKVADFNNDNLDDIIYGNAGQANKICLSDGDRTFTCQNVSAETRDTRDLEVGDLNADGNMDFVSGNMSTDRTEICLGAGDGTFSCSDIGAGSFKSTNAIALGDMDNDGDLDVFLGTYGGSDWYCKNNGNGTFAACIDIGGTVTNALDTAFFDYNGDSYLDLVVGTDGDKAKYYINDANGTSAVLSTRLDFPDPAFHDSFGVEIFDFELDGDDDVYFARDGENDTKYINNAGWNGGSVSGTGSLSRRTSRADINGDGHIDIIVAQYGATNKVCYSDNSLTFIPCTDFGGATATSRDVELGDFDGDGYYDIVEANETQYNMVLFGYNSAVENPPVAGNNGTLSVLKGSTGIICSGSSSSNTCLTKIINIKSVK